MTDSHVVLIVEDDDAVGEAMTDALEDHGYVAQRAGNGQEALSLLRSGLAPCLILLDLMMPVMNGWELHAEMQRDPVLAIIPVCVISACGGTTQPLPAGTKDVLPKPVQLLRLISMVEQHC